MTRAEKIGHLLGGALHRLPLSKGAMILWFFVAHLVIIQVAKVYWTFVSFIWNLW